MMYICIYSTPEHSKHVHSIHLYLNSAPDHLTFVHKVPTVHTVCTAHLNTVDLYMYTAPGHSTQANARAS
jgi:hypothetical protein